MTYDEKLFSRVAELEARLEVATLRIWRVESLLKEAIKFIEANGTYKDANWYDEAKSYLDKRNQ